MLSERFWAKVDKTDTCWLWTGATARNGYGQVGIDGRTRSAHRVSYEALVGPIPDGLVIDHLCRVRHCVNPDHMEPVTSGENTRRGASAQVERCVNGHPLVAPNLHVRQNRPGRRECRVCNFTRRRAVDSTRKTYRNRLDVDAILRDAEAALRTTA